MRTLAILSEKGGTAKTTTTINVAAALAEMRGEGRGARGEEFKILVIDNDPQGNATLVLNQNRPIETPTLGDVLLGEAAAGEAIVPTAIAGVDLLPASAELAEVNMRLTVEMGREERLRAALETLARPSSHAPRPYSYDFILVDCSPQRTLLHTNALNAVAEVIVPIDPCIFGVEGLAQLEASIDNVRRYLRHDVRIGGLLLTRVKKDNVCRDVEHFLRGKFGELVFAATVPHNVKIKEAHGAFQSVLHYAPRSPGAKAYRAVVEELLRPMRGEGRGARDEQAAEDEQGADHGRAQDGIAGTVSGDGSGSGGEAGAAVVAAA